MVNDGRTLEQMTEQEIRMWAAEYDPNAADPTKSTPEDRLIGDIVGYSAKKRKACYEWVKAHDAALNTETAAEPVPEQPVEKETTEESTGATSDNKLIKKIMGKVKYLEKIGLRLKEGESKDVAGDIARVRILLDEIPNLIKTLPAGVVDADKANAVIGVIDSVKKEITTIEAQTQVQQPVQQPVQQQSPQQPVQQQHPQTQQGAAAAHTEGAFNIGNFIKSQQPIYVPNVQQQRPVVFPHQMGLTQQQIADEVNKHFKLIPKDKRDYTITADALYDLINDKRLSQKMKELGSKQRPNNPYLTQVNITDYIDIPKLLQSYQLCFTTPCKDNRKIIVILFNPNPVPDNNGVLHYPLHIFDARKTNGK